MAAEATVARIMNCGPEDAKQRKMEIERVLGERLGDLRVDWDPARRKEYRTWVQRLQALKR